MKIAFPTVLGLTCWSLASGVVLEDFDDPYKGQTTYGWKLPAQAKASYWYGYDDWNHGKAGLGTLMIPDVVHDDTSFAKAVESDCGERKACLHVRFIGGTGYAYPFAGVGFNFLTEGADVDLSSMDSITFRAKGKGSFRFKLMTKHITDDFDRKNYWADMGKTFRLTDAWRAYRLSVDDIQPQAGAPLADTATWQECMDRTRKIHLTTPETFKAKDTVDLWIDDLVMHGVTPAVFGGTWQEDAPSRTRHRGPSREAGLWRTSQGLCWNVRMVSGLELVGLDGRCLRSLDPRDGALSVRDLPKGVWVLRVRTRQGGEIRSDLLAVP